MADRSGNGPALSPAVWRPEETITNRRRLAAIAAEEPTDQSDRLRKGDLMSGDSGAVTKVELRRVFAAAPASVLGC